MAIFAIWVAMTWIWWTVTRFGNAVNERFDESFAFC